MGTGPLGHTLIGRLLRCLRSRHRVLILLVLSTLFASLLVRPARAADPAHLGYGTTGGVEALGFDWIKTLYSPSGDQARRLVRVDLRASHLGSLDAWLADLDHSVRYYAQMADAYEIGNEPNLDASYGWGAPPDAADYTYALCRAYATIKAADPDALVVTAGLAPTGRIPFTWEGHKGYCAPGVSWCPVYYQDEREFLREMLRAGAGACFDALGYHPYGFSAPYDAAPGSAACGPNDFCFRSVERIHDILYGEFGLTQPVWPTEFGWIVDPRLVGKRECWNDPSMVPFQWMVVSQEAQATNLVGAYQYAESHYPWMGAMFLFNYGIGGGCDQMGFFNIQGRPAEAALAAMSKRYVPGIAAWRGTRNVVVNVGGEGVASGQLWLDNLTYGPLNWHAALVPGATLDGRLSLQVSDGDITQPVRFSIDATGLAPGLHTGRLALTATAPLGLPVTDAQQEVSVGVLVATDRIYVPMVSR